MFGQDLAYVSIFRNLAPRQLELLGSLVDRCVYPEGAQIFDQGDAARFLYILRKGEVLVYYKAYDGPVITVTRVAPGGVFGWSAALGRERYTSGASAIEESEALRISGASLRKLCEQDPQTGEILLDRLARGVAERNAPHDQVLTMLTRGADQNGVSQRRVPNNGRK